MDVLLNADNGREVAFDGESSGGAVSYFEQLCYDKEIRRNPGVVLNWYLFCHKLLSRFSLINHTLFKVNP